MGKIITAKQAAEWLIRRDNFLLITHVRPDGDTLGSSAALAQVLQEQGKTAYILPNPEVTPRYFRFVVDYQAPDDFLPEHIISIDTASTSLFPKTAEKYKESVSLCIDHHGSNVLYADLVCLDSERASCGEVIFDIMIEMKCSVSSKTAESLYVALSTDTGCFSFSNTSANTLLVAS